MIINWDSKKAKLNLKKHRIAFEEAATALSDPMSVTGADQNVKSDISLIVVLRPEVAQAFPNEEAVNNALLSLIKIAHKTIRPTNGLNGRE